MTTTTGIVSVAAAAAVTVVAERRGEVLDDGDAAPRNFAGNLLTEGRGEVELTLLLFLVLPGVVIFGEVAVAGIAVKVIVGVGDIAGTANSIFLLLVAPPSSSSSSSSSSPIHVTLR